MNPINPIIIDGLSDEQLLELRFCELPIDIKGTPLEDCISQLYKELGEKGISFHPACYIADEWLCPDGEPIVGIPFYLAHPRLKKLEQKMMLEVEGGTYASCMQLLRHETGHAINYAYLLHKRRKWKQLFGPFDKDYPDRYKYRPYSKSFVHHLEGWYAQYHPDEDFAETFAVWLDPKSNWRETYKKWKAIKKLEYVDEIMCSIGSKTPKIVKGKKYWDVEKMKTVLGRHYKKRRKLQAVDLADFHDYNLLKIFTSPEEKSKRVKAHKFLQANKADIIKYTATWTGEKKFIINRLLRNLITRCRELKLEVRSNEHKEVIQLSTYITAQIMNYLYTGRYKKK